MFRLPERRLVKWEKLVGLGWGLGLYIPDHHPEDSLTGLRITLDVARLYTTVAFS